jgi:hypothetical protein
MSQDVSVRGTGGAIFAGILLIIGGALWIVEGLAGIIRGSSYINSANTLITTSAGTWGWIHLIGGIIGVAAGFGIFSGAAWARLLGILIATSLDSGELHVYPVTALVGLNNHLHRPVGDPRAVRTSTTTRPRLIMSRKPAAPLRTDCDRSCSPSVLFPSLCPKTGRAVPGQQPAQRCSARR